nr:hypothetical protein [Tanacetum cinerariifolium]
MASLADKAILSGVDNRPPMLEKDMYDSWKSRMELYMLNRQHGRMILESVEQGPLIWRSVEVERVTRLNKYSKLSAAEAIQADCDVKATNIILQGLPPEIAYAPMVQQSSEYSPPEAGLVVPVFLKGDDPIDAINHMMSFLTSVVASLTNNAAYQADDLDAYDSDCDEINSAKIALMANLSHYGSDNLAENSTLPALQDDLILSVIEQLKTQVVTCTKINQDNKHVNELLTAELEIYKSQERVLNELKNDEKASTSYEYSQEIESLKHTLSEYLKETESFKQKITILKDDLQKEESRNIDREVALEKETESYAEQAFWSQYSVQTDEPTHSGTTIVEVPKELPKVSVVNSCLKRLKFHLASFDIVVKERTTATAITEGTWGFEHTKACFRDDIIPFVKNLKELFTLFDQCLIDEVTERDVVSSSESALTFAELFEINELKAQIQEKDTLILKLKEKLKSISGDVKERKVERDAEEIETLNLELDHKVTKLAAENEHLKQTYKQLF